MADGGVGMPLRFLHSQSLKSYLCQKFIVETAVSRKSITDDGPFAFLSINLLATLQLMQ